MKALRVIILCMSLLLVCLSKVEVTELQRIHRAGRQYDCSYKDQPINCVNNPRIRIVKDDHYYYIEILERKIQFLVCNHICRDCNELLSETGQGKNVKQAVHVHSVTMIIII